MDEQALDIIELELAVLVRHITSITSEKAIGKLERSAYLLLHQIETHGSAGVKALADEFHLDISTVSRQVAALEKKGYVLRLSDPSDGRASYFQITELGRTELADTKMARVERVSKRMASWSQEETEVFARLLRKFNHSLYKTTDLSSK